MVPYANRIAGNAFDFGDRTWRFAANNPPERFNVHGTGWHFPWTAEQGDDGTVLLSLEYIAPSEPYSYRATQRFELAAGGLGLAMKASPVFGHLMLYADPERSYFCLEPQSNAPCAFNRIASGRQQDMGVFVLDPGQTATGRVGFFPFALELRRS